MTKMYVVSFDSRMRPEEGEVDVSFSERLGEANRYVLRGTAQGDCNYLNLVKGLKTSIGGREYLCDGFSLEETGDGQFAISCMARAVP